MGFQNRTHHVSIKGAAYYVNTYKDAGLNRINPILNHGFADFRIAYSKYESVNF